MLSYLVGTLLACLCFGTVTYYMGVQHGYERARDVLGADTPRLDGETREILDAWTGD